jgi:hypothetical protein
MTSIQVGSVIAGWFISNVAGAMLYKNAEENDGVFLITLLCMASAALFVVAYYIGIETPEMSLSLNKICLPPNQIGNGSLYK